jgi:hypothetical protein
MIYFERKGIVIRTAIEGDIDAVSADIRREDAEEVRAEGDTVRAALERSFGSSSLRFTALRDGVPVAIFGLVPDAIAGTHAVVWLLGAEGLRRIPKTFLRLSRGVIAHFLTLYPVLYNRVDARYAGTIRWLESCGASFQDPLPVGAAGEPFRTFTIKRGT